MPTIDEINESNHVRRFGSWDESTWKEVGPKERSPVYLNAYKAWLQARQDFDTLKPDADRILSDVRLSDVGKSEKLAELHAAHVKKMQDAEYGAHKYLAAAKEALDRREVEMGKPVLTPEEKSSIDLVLSEALKLDNETLQRLFFESEDVLLLTALSRIPPTVLRLRGINADIQVRAARRIFERNLTDGAAHFLLKRDRQAVQNAERAAATLSDYLEGLRPKDSVSEDDAFRARLVRPA